ncbi:MAG: adenosylmethionine--8-amino-7-oxononanoate transaminase [Acidimicrobiia bacterium]|nr:adenosylmethionine--8-amino-7-oxononanoate transaminase [Acidimicrobiia bacterium]
MSCYADNTPLIIDRAEGRELVDTDGNRYLDAISSLWVTTLGHRVPELDDAVRAQLDRVAHTTLLGNGNTATIRFTEALVPRLPTPGCHVLYASDGAAAVEQALRIAFQWWTNQGEHSRQHYLALGDAYHGDTIGALSLGAGGFGTDVYDPLRFPVLRTPGYHDPHWDDAAVAALDEHGDELAALVIEPLVQGAAGMAVTTPQQVRRVVDHAQALGILVIADEVAVGFGRTGTLFASEQCGIEPDLVAMGKGITGGYLPLSATAASPKVYDGFLGEDLSETTLYHGHSYSGNALACAVALRHLELLDDWDVLTNVVARADELGTLLAEQVTDAPGVGDVRRRGLMTGVELAPPADGLRWGRRVCAAAVRRGVLLRPLGDVVVLMPPLTVTAEEINRIVETLAAALDEVCGD